MKKIFFILLLAVVPLLAIEKEPLQEYRARRERLADLIAGNVLVLKAAPEQELVEYQQEHNFYYLTGFDEPNAILLLNATTTPPDEILFIPERKPAEERWTGAKLGPGPEAEKVTGFTKVLPLSEFDWSLAKASEGNQTILGLKEVADKIAAMRQVKSATEIALMQKAMDITLASYKAAFQTFKEGMTQGDLIAYFVRQIEEVTGEEIPIVVWGQLDDDEGEKFLAQVGFARALQRQLGAPPLWPCVMLTAEHCEEVARRLAKITPALLDEALLPDWEYQAEHKLPVIPEPLGFVSLGRSAKRADPVATMGFATLMVLLTLAVIVLFVLDKPWVPG